MAAEPPDAPDYQLVERDGYVHVVLRGRPRLEVIVSMFQELGA
jgi:hypothetical protein